MLLSICIPTYDRPLRVEAALRRYEQIIAKNGLEDKVEICISDNTPTNETHNVVEKFVNEGKIELRYRQNKENLGYDGNGPLAMGMARGKYLHLVADEDLYLEKKLVEYVNVLESEKPDCIIISDHKMAVPGPRWYNVAEGEILGKMLAMHGVDTYFFAPLSCMIMKTDDFHQFDKMIGGAPGIFLGSIFSHVPVCLLALKQARSAYVTEEHFREIEDATKRISTTLVHLPHNSFRMVLERYFNAMKKSVEIGLIGKDDYAIFLDRFFWHGIYYLFTVRVCMGPEVMKIDRDETVKYAFVFADNYGLVGARRMIFSSYVSLLYSALPYHWIYATRTWYLKNVKKQDVTDILQIRKGKFAEKKKFEAFEDREPEEYRK